MENFLQVQVEFEITVGCIEKTGLCQRKSWQKMVKEMWNMKGDKEI